MDPVEILDLTSAVAVRAHGPLFEVMRLDDLKPMSPQTDCSAIMGLDAKVGSGEGAA